MSFRDRYNHCIRVSNGFCGFLVPAKAEIPFSNSVYVKKVVSCPVSDIDLKIMRECQSRVQSC